MAYGNNVVVMLISASNRFKVLYLVNELKTLASFVRRASASAIVISSLDSAEETTGVLVISDGV